jgi:hypothetical protein
MAQHVPGACEAMKRVLREECALELPAIGRVARFPLHGREPLYRIVFVPWAVWPDEHTRLHHEAPASWDVVLQRLRGYRLRELGPGMAVQRVERV